VPKRSITPSSATSPLAYEALELPGDNGQRILVYTAEPDSLSQEGLNLLASWSATPTPSDANAIEDR
jgi:hypothetical protein